MSDYWSLTLLGHDGSRWPLIGPDAPDDEERGVTLAPGAEQLIDAPVQTKWLKKMFSEQYQGKKFKLRKPILSVDIVGDDPDDWRELDSQFRMALDYDEESTLESVTADGVRRLGVRLFQEPDAYGNKDPHLTAHSNTRFVLACEWPLYVGDPYVVTRTLQSGTAGTLLLPAWNPCDVPAYLQYALTADVENIEWRLPDWSWKNDAYANRTVLMPKLKLGEHLTVDSWPEEERFVSHLETPVWARAAGRDLLVPMPAHTGTAQDPIMLPVSVTGGQPGSSVTLRIPRMHTRPFGGVR
jgi:hypothetical protein